ncbi:MAG TPA: TIGR02710 family CRISPR-associated CARF protein [Desulfomonilia bacterium]
MKRALIMTVGTGTNPSTCIVKPLVKSVKNSRPDFLVLIATQTSRDYATTIASESQLAEDAFEIIELNDMENFQSVFSVINEVFENLRLKGFALDDIEVDFTSGTKAMSAGAVLSATYNQCQSIKYITGKREGGVVKDGTEEFRTIIPQAVFSLHDLKLAEQMIYNLRFSPALQIISGINKNTLSASENNRLKALKDISSFYENWDIFNHKKAYKKLSKINWTGFEIFKPEEKACELIELLSNNKPETVRPQLIIDIFNNAVRRSVEGKYDDAVARLYRVVELIAQHILSSCYKIKTGDVNIDKVPESRREKLEKTRDKKDNKIKIGLFASYDLLSELGHESGKIFYENEQLQGYLKNRNSSIMAHGLDPINETIFKGLKENVVELAEFACPNFPDIARQCQFPWIDYK